MSCRPAVATTSNKTDGFINWSYFSNSAEILKNYPETPDWPQAADEEEVEEK